jgi:hypothetical protein
MGNYVMALKFTAFVSYVLGKISVKFHRFIRHFKEVRENVSIISEQPSYTCPGMYQTVASPSCQEVDVAPAMNLADSPTNYALLLRKP